MVGSLLAPEPNICLTETVLVYDGRAEKFNLGWWWGHGWSCTAPLLLGSAVMVFFSA